MSNPFGGIDTTLNALRPDLALCMQSHSHGFYHSTSPPYTTFMDPFRSGKLENSPSHWTQLDHMRKITNGCTMLIKSQTTLDLASYG